MSSTNQMVSGISRLASRIVHDRRAAGASLCSLKPVVSERTGGLAAKLRTSGHGKTGACPAMSDIGVTLRPSGASVVVGEARSHTVTIDRPVEKEGSDAGPMGGELLLLALGGCYLSTFLAALKLEDPEADATAVTVRVLGELVPAPTRFTELTVRVTAPADQEGLLAKPLLKAERGCIVHNSIRDGLVVRFSYEWL